MKLHMHYFILQIHKKQFFTLTYNQENGASVNGCS